MIQIILQHSTTEHFYTVFVNNIKARRVAHSSTKKLANLNCHNGCNKNSTITIYMSINGNKDVRFDDDFCCHGFREYAYGIYNVPEEINKIHASHS